MSPDRRIVLAFPPFSTPVSPPLGIATLKNHVDVQVPGWEARVLDLNLAYHEAMYAQAGQEDAPAYLHNAVPDNVTLVPQAMDFFRGDLDTLARGGRQHMKWGFDLVEFFQLNAQMLIRRLAAFHKGGAPAPRIFEDFADQIVAENPDAVGISVCYNEQFWPGMCLAKLVKQRCDAPVILGGTVFLHDADQTLNDFKDVVDFIVTGDGELTLGQLLANPDQPDEVPGLCWSRGGIARANEPAYMKKLDELGDPDFSDFELDRYFSPEPVLPLTTSRGCYWRRCTFCTHYQSYGLNYRLHTLDHFIVTLRRYTEQGIRHFNFVDEMISPKRFRQLGKAILEAGLDVSYCSMARPTKDFDRDTLQLMADSGCRFIIWGFESGNQRVLDLIEKGTIVEDVEQVLHTAAEVGIFNHTFVIFGYPTETKEEALDTLRFLERNKHVVHHAHRSFFTLDRGAPMFYAPEKFKITKMWPISGYPYQNNYEYECPEGVSREDVKALAAEATPFLRTLNPYAPTVGRFREHALLLYAKYGKELRAQERNFPPHPGLTAAAEPAARSVAKAPARKQRKVDHALATMGMRWWMVALGILLVAPAIVFVGLRVRNGIKVRRNRQEHPDFEVQELPGFLSDEECDHLIRLARTRLDNSGGSKPDADWMSQVQRGSMAFLDTDDTVRAIQQRVSDLTGVPPSRYERLQVVHYDRFEFYGPHSDTLGKGPDADGGAGDRVSTVMFYLSDDHEGGATFFPDYGVRIAPEKGKAIYFQNLTLDAENTHPLASHVGEPVLEGDKWISNQWIRQGFVQRARRAAAAPAPAPASASAKPAPRSVGGPNRPKRVRPQRSKKRKRKIR